MSPHQTHQSGRIQSRPNTGRHFKSSTTGFRRTGLETIRDGAIYVPESFKTKKSTALIVSLHGAGGDAHHGIEPFRDLADHTGSIILAPESQGPTWDFILQGFGPDVHWIDEALSDIFSLYPIDPTRIALAGFSDGASYALSLGPTNGDLFTHIMAFSPGFSDPVEIRDSPPIFISHGILDDVLSIDACSRKLVPQLKKAKLPVTYREFEGGHTIPTEIGHEAFVWFLGQNALPDIYHSKIRSDEAGIEAT